MHGLSEWKICLAKFCSLPHSQGRPPPPSPPPPKLTKGTWVLCSFGLSIKSWSEVGERWIQRAETYLAVRVNFIIYFVLGESCSNQPFMTSCFLHTQDSTKKKRFRSAVSTDVRVRWISNNQNSDKSILQRAGSWFP